MENSFPYDLVADVHHMLIPIDCYKTEEDCPSVVLEEAGLIFDELNEEGFYDCMMRNFTIAQSVPTHLHYHLLKWKRV